MSALVTAQLTELVRCVLTIHVGQSSAVKFQLTASPYVTTILPLVALRVGPFEGSELIFNVSPAISVCDMVPHVTRKPTTKPVSNCF
jgi:hypothetical protein